MFGCGLVLMVAAASGKEDAIDAPPSADRPLQLKSGPITGLVQDGVRTYLGIPYAAPPIGERRWKPPVAPEPWTEPRPMTKLGPTCPQPIIMESAFLGISAKDMQEDCLHLTVWTAAKASDKLPVMVWIHGGGFFMGKGAISQRDGIEMAKRGVVVVTLNYRLGPFGFLAHPALTKESPEHASGNYGLLDQVFALRWVRDNIAQFGGDPGNVTVFGESAGACSICGLLTTPLTEGLIHKAIVQSGHALALPLGLRYRGDKHDGLDSSESLGEACADTLGVANEADVLKALRDKPWADLVAAYPPGQLLPGVLPSDLVCVDGHVFRESPSQIWAKGKQIRVPLLIGTVADEGSIFATMARIEKAEEAVEYLKLVCGDRIEKALELYPVTDAPAGKQALQDFVGDWFRAGARQTARRMKAAGQPTYLYQFTRIPTLALPLGLGCCHGLDCVYTFHIMPAALGFTDTDHKLSQAMMDYWTRFAKTGDPNGDGAPTWPAYDAEKDQYLELGDHTRVGQHLRSKQCDFFDTMGESPKSEK
jgi:para-nitrobenzyl esterase